MKQHRIIEDEAEYQSSVEDRVFIGMVIGCAILVVSAILYLIFEV